MLGVAIVLSTIAVTVWGQVEMELVDGRILTGTDVRREGDEWVLSLERQGKIILPDELVTAVRLFGNGDTRDDVGTKVLKLPAGPETRTGYEATVPTPSEQLNVLGEPSQFQKSVVDSTWVPDSDWDMDPERQNNFNPSTWAKSPIDPAWKMESDWAAGDNALESSRSTWQKGSIDSEWIPTDGFQNSVGSGRD